MRKIVAEDSNGAEYSIAYNGDAPADLRYSIQSKALPRGVRIEAASIPQALDALRAYMRNHGRCLLTYDLHAGTIVCNDVTGEIMERMKSR